MRVIIISQPKAGTYLCSNLLQEFDLQYTGMHMGTAGFQKYGQGKDYEGLYDPVSVTTYLDLGEALELIPEDGFAVCHLPYDIKFAKMFRGFKLINLVRDFEECKDSYTRFRDAWGRNPWKLTEKEFNTIAEWGSRGAFQMNFYDMLNKNIPKINELQRFLFGDTWCNSYDAITAALKKDSLTKSDKR